METKPFTHSFIGLLKITDLSKGDYLPDDPSTACEADQSAGEYCFLAGDVRVNEQAGLAAMHTIFMREHNRIARKLKAENSRWSGNTIFEVNFLLLRGQTYFKIHDSHYLKKTKMLACFP